jgi:hypothetical protein
VTLDIDNYAGLVLKLNLARNKADQLAVVKAIHNIEEKAWEDSTRIGKPYLDILFLIKENYPSISDLI